MNAEHQRYVDQYIAQLSETERAQVPKVLAEYFCADEYNTMVS